MRRQRASGGSRPFGWVLYGRFRYINRRCRFGETINSGSGGSTGTGSSGIVMMHELPDVALLNRMASAIEWHRNRPTQGDP